jgi:3-hydroxyisobutyrate dehydrogenase-like beta-hydroxyacid dehydrogenase
LADHSTIPPSDTRRLADRLAHQAGSVWIDAPVSGGISGARAGTLAVFAGGPGDAVEIVRPVLECFASNVTHMGPVGSGQVAKACNQIIGFLSFAAVAEALALGDRHGIDTSRLARAFEGGFADTPVLREWQRALTQDETLLGPALHVEAFRTHLLGKRDGPDYSGPSPANLSKDLRIIRDLADEAQCSLPLIDRMSGFVEQVRAADQPKRND